MRRGSAKAAPRPLPRFTKWPGGMWCYGYRGELYFAARLEDGWAVAAESDQMTRLVKGRKSKAAAVRAAMDLIDGKGKA